MKEMFGLILGKSKFHSWWTRVQEVSTDCETSRQVLNACLKSFDGYGIEDFDQSEDEEE